MQQRVVVSNCYDYIGYKQAQVTEWSYCDTRTELPAAFLQGEQEGPGWGRDALAADLAWLSLSLRGSGLCPKT